MNKEHKLRFIKEFNKATSSIYVNSIKQICSNSDAKCQNRPQLVAFFEGKGVAYASELSWMLHMNISQMYQTKHYFYFFGFRFPSDFSSYEDLVSKVEVQVKLKPVYERIDSCHNKWLKLTDLQAIACDIEFLGAVYERTNATKQNMRTPSSIVYELFSYVLLNREECHQLCTALRDNSVLLEDTLLKLESFLSDRAEMNRLKKNKKQVHNNLKKHPKVLENEVKISALQAQVRQLEQENRQIILNNPAINPIEAAQDKAGKSGATYMAAAKKLSGLDDIRKQMRNRSSSEIMETIFSRI